MTYRLSVSMAAVALLVLLVLAVALICPPDRQRARTSWRCPGPQILTWSVSNIYQIRSVVNTGDHEGSGGQLNPPYPPHVWAVVFERGKPQGTRVPHPLACSTPCDQVRSRGPVVGPWLSPQTLHRTLLESERTPTSGDKSNIL